MLAVGHVLRTRASAKGLGDGEKPGGALSTGRSAGGFNDPTGPGCET